MKWTIGAGAGLVVVCAAFAVHADQKKYDAKFCAAAESFRANAAELNAIGPQSTVAEARAAQNRVNHDVQQMRSAAGWINTPTAKQFVTTTDRLDKDLNKIPDDATLQQEHDRIKQDVQDAQAAGRQLATEAGCPPPQ
jgi:hypothetical protein